MSVEYFVSLASKSVFGEFLQSVDLWNGQRISPKQVEPLVISALTANRQCYTYSLRVEQVTCSDDGDESQVMVWESKYEPITGLFEPYKVNDKQVNTRQVPVLIENIRKGLNHKIYTTYLPHIGKSRVITPTGEKDIFIRQDDGSILTACGTLVIEPYYIRLVA